MKNKLLILLTVLAFVNSTAQNWQWVRSAGGNKSDKATDIGNDQYGNQYVVGYYNTPTSGSVSFGAINPTANFGKEGFLAKINKAGNWQWVRTAEGGWDERVLGVCVDTINKFVYATGTAWLGTDFGSCIGAWGNSDQIFVTKFDYNGNCIWHINAGGDGDDQGYDLVTAEDGDIYLTGFISDKYATGTVVATFGGINVPIPFADSLAFVSKISSAGVFQWVRTFGGCDGERDNRIAIDASENIYVTGGFYGTKAFGTSTLNSTAGSVDIFVTKYNPTGTHLWARKVGSNLDDRGNSITVDKFGGIYVTGEFRDSVVFGIDTLRNFGGPNGRDIFVAKITQAGNWIWSDKAGSSSGSDRGNGIISNSKGNVFVTGQFKNNCKFSPTLSLTNTFDSVQVFVAGIDTGGVWRWALQGGSLNEDRGNSICTDDSCNIYSCGFYELTATFGANSVTSSGLKDIYVAKINNTCFNNIINTGINNLLVQNDNLALYPNPADNYITVRGPLNFNEISVTDITGKIILSEKFNETTNAFLNISSLTEGVYVVMLKSNNETLYRKLIKN